MHTPPSPGSLALVLSFCLVSFHCTSDGSKGGGSPTPATGGARSGTGGTPSASGGSPAAGGASGGSSPDAANPGSGGVGMTGGQGGVATPGLDAPIASDTPAAETPAQGNPLRIYFIDAEGGSATLLVAPTGESLLADTGWQGGVRRAVETLKAATGGTKLDYFLATHYHVDHVSDTPALARMAQVAGFIDHGESVEGGGDYNNYRNGVMASMAGAKRITATPGMKIMLGAVELTIVTAARKAVRDQPAAIANPACAGSSRPGEVNDEDPQSVGFVARHGKFEFVALGDLTAGVEYDLACPMNQLGLVDLFQVSQHGSSMSSPVELVNGVAPLVAVFNNGAGKGGDGPIFERWRRVPNIAVWSLHSKSGQSAAQNADPDLTANLAGPDMGHGLSASAYADGSFTVTNARTKMSRSYTSR